MIASFLRRWTRSAHGRMPNAEAESGLHPACPRVERREARGEEDAARPGSFRWESTAGSCYEVGGRKTQLGQGLHWVTSGLGKLRRREAASLRRHRKPARVEAAVSRSQLHRRHERPVEATDALRPGCRGRDAGRTSTQALRTKRSTHSGQGIPTSEAAFRRARLNPSDHLSQRESGRPSGATVRRARLNPSGQLPWAAVRRARLDPMQPVPDSGGENPPGF